MSLSNFLGGAIVLLLGCVFRAYDAYDGLSGFANLDDDHWDKIALGRFITTRMIASGAVLLAGGVLCLIGFYPLISISVTWGFMVAALLGGVIYANASGRFKK
jgi:hypothetical protein